MQTEFHAAGATLPDDPESRAALAEFADAGALLTGHFMLSSGLRSAVYLQCARVMMDPARGARLCERLARRLTADGGALAGLPAADRPTTVIAPAMGAVIVGYELARALGLRSVFLERPDGVFTLRRGFDLAPGAPCLLVEDVVTTGKSSRECAAAAETAGARVVAAACLVDRSGGAANVGAPLTPLLRIDAPTYAPDQLPPELAAIPPVKPGSRRSVDPTPGDAGGSTT